MRPFWIIRITCIGKLIHSGNQTFSSVISTPEVLWVTRDLQLVADIQLLLPLRNLLLSIARDLEVIRGENDSNVKVYCLCPTSSGGWSANSYKELGKEAVGNCSCSNTLVIGADVKPRLMRADCISLVHRPIWKSSLDNIIHRSCSLSIFQTENHFIFNDFLF